MLQDIATVTGATLISKDVGLLLEEAELNVLGRAASIVVTKEHSTIVGGMGHEAPLASRMAQLRQEIARCTSPYDKEKLEERLAKLAGGVAVISVGALTEVAMKEKKERVEDALHATRAAVAEGVVPGGGVALLRAVKALDSLLLEGDEAIGVQVLRRALFAPAIAIADNAGKRGEVIAEKIFEAEGAFGYNALKDCFEDLTVAGVIDPVKVTRSALQYAASIAGMLWTTAVMITDKPEPKTAAAAPMGGMPHGMGGMGGMGMM
jgi:chaperonin GroEL